MIKKSITYDGFEGEPVTKDYYFHLSVKKMTEMAEDGFADRLSKVGNTAQDGGANGVEIMNTIRDLIGRSYGLRVLDDQFKQSEEISCDFLESLPFDALFTELLNDPAKVVEFINSLIPAALLAEVEAKMAANTLELPGQDAAWPKDEAMPPTPDQWNKLQDERSGLKTPRDKGNKLLPWALREPTDAEIQAMTRAQMADVFQRKSSGWLTSISE